MLNWTVNLVFSTKLTILAVVTSTLGVIPISVTLIKYWDTFDVVVNAEEREGHASRIFGVIAILIRVAGNVCTV